LTFENIKNITLSDSKNWNDKIFITFDIDWCSDEVLSYTLDLIEEYNIKATFFVTHETQLLERMRRNPDIELGIHPNFNPLMNGNPEYGKNSHEVLEYFKNIVPEAVSIRSHSMTQSSTMLNLFERYGFKFDCNTFIPYSSGITVRPYKHWTTLVKIPHFWEDDIHCLYQWEWQIHPFIQNNGLRVFDFHPIHIFLNTETLDRYEQAKCYADDYQKLQTFQNNTSFGAKDFLMALIKGDQ
jgi:hypothetical protein